MLDLWIHLPGPRRSVFGELLRGPRTPGTAPIIIIIIIIVVASASTQASSLPLPPSRRPPVSIVIGLLSSPLSLQIERRVRRAPAGDRRGRQGARKKHHHQRQQQQQQRQQEQQLICLRDFYAGCKEVRRRPERPVGFDARFFVCCCVFGSISPFGTPFARGPWLQKKVECSIFIINNRRK